MKIDVRKQRGQNATLRSAFGRMAKERAIHDAGCQHGRNEREDAFITDALFDQFEQNRMVDVVKTAFDVTLDDPEVFVLGRDAALAGADAVHRAATRAKAIRTL